MAEKTQQEYLQAAKHELGLEWDQLAVQAGIKPRALKTYRMPESSRDSRGMPSLAKDAIDRLLEEHKKRMKKALKST